MYPYLVAFASNNAPGIASRRAKAALSRVPIEGFTVADVILVVGQLTRGSLTFYSFYELQTKNASYER